MNYSKDELSEKMENLCSIAGIESVLDELVQEMSDVELQEKLEDLCRAFDISFEDDI